MARVYDNLIEPHEHVGQFKNRRKLATCVARMIPLPKCRMIRHNSRHAAF
jgi:hypothetical protein